MSMKWISPKLSFSFLLLVSSFAGAESQQLEQQLRFEQFELHREFGVKTERQIPMLRDLAELYLSRGQNHRAVIESRFAYQLSEGFDDSSMIETARHANLLSATGRQQEAYKRITKSLDSSDLSPLERQQLLISLGDLGLHHSGYLGRSIQALDEASVLSSTHDHMTHPYINLRLADLNLIAGNVKAAHAIYQQLWRDYPDNRSDWFNKPRLLKAGGQQKILYNRQQSVIGVQFLVSKNGRAKHAKVRDRISSQHRASINHWLSKAVFRPQITDGLPQGEPTSLQSLLTAG